MPVAVSVVMPVYNAERFLRQAIESILNQTFTDFEFIIVNDGSTDVSPLIIEEYKKQDSRIIVHNLPQNMGIVSAMNSGCKLAHGKYIAVMHSDDISMPDRLEKQVVFLNGNSDISVVGANIQTVDESGEYLEQSRMPLLPVHLKWELLFGSALAHPTVMMRVSDIAPIGFYKFERFPAEDYDLWTRLAKVVQLANLPDILLHYRVWSQSITGRLFSREEEQAEIIARASLMDLLGEDVPIIIVAHLRSTLVAPQGIYPNNHNDIKTTIVFLEHIFNVFIEKYTQLESTEVDLIRQVAARQMYRLARHSLKHSFKSFSLVLYKAIRHSPTLIVEEVFRKLALQDT